MAKPVSGLPGTRWKVSNGSTWRQGRKGPMALEVKWISRNRPETTVVMLCNMKAVGGPEHDACRLSTILTDVVADKPTPKN